MNSAPALEFLAPNVASDPPHHSAGRAAGDSADPAAAPVLDRMNVFPHVEERMGMTVREWLYFHNVMHRHYTRYHGRALLKPPFDLMVLQDIVFDTRPEIIIEIGAFEGGATLWLAHLLDTMNCATEIITIDVRAIDPPLTHPRIRCVVGDAAAPATRSRVETLAAGRRGFVIEDSDHKQHVTRALLEHYWRYVAVGNYFLVEDTIVEAMQLPPYPGPLPAVREFLDSQGGRFVCDRSREKYILTYNPSGYLMRVRD